jgi:hypothetical protein
MATDTVGQNPTGRPRKSSAGTRRKKAKQQAAQSTPNGGR